MTALFGGELRRVVARRLVRALAGLAVLGVAVAGVIVFLNTGSISDTELVARRTAADRAVEACVRGQPVELDGRQVKGLRPETPRGRSSASSPSAGSTTPASNTGT